MGVIVRYAEGAGQAAAQQAVTRVGGTVGQQLDLIGAFTAQVPEQAIAALRGAVGIAAVTPNADVTFAPAPAPAPAPQPAQPVTTRPAPAVGRRPGRLLALQHHQVHRRPGRVGAGHHRCGGRRRADRLRRRPGRRAWTAPARSSTARTCPSSRRRRTCATWTPSATARTWPASSPAGTPRAPGRPVRPTRRASPAWPRARTWSTSRSPPPTARPTSPRSSRRSTGSSRTATTRA